jgi:hypothetical protein
VTLRQLTDLWVERLNLADWDIRVRYASKKELGENYGDCNWNPDERKARIRVRRPGVLRKDGEHLEDVLLHELLHLVLQGHAWEEEPYNVHIERADNALVEALIGGYGRVSIPRAALRRKH